MLPLLYFLAAKNAKDAKEWKAVMENKNNLPLEPRSGSIFLAVGFNPRSAASGITHSPIGEQNAARCAYQTDAAEKLPRMDSALGVLLDG